VPHYLGEVIVVPTAMDAWGHHIAAPDISQKLTVQEFYPVGACGADFATYLRKQYDSYGRIIREANIKAE
jgi:tripartite-type tricarboxylate transporter receptor subunit TctC